jgi:tRNA modification GTPase
VRLSGPDVKTIAESLFGELPKPRYARLTDFVDESGDTIDTGLILYFQGPNSFTGEDVLEFQGHGGPYVLQSVMERLMQLGARAARPGEFSERAFLNDKMDLVQAEAIADLIDSGSGAAARAAQRSLQGIFSDRVNQLRAILMELRVFVEATIDFADDDIDFLAESDVLERLDQGRDQLTGLLREAGQGKLLRDGIVLAIIGRPNAGKSSLLNALSGLQSAIVTEIPGTTRDVLREQIEIGGIPVHLADTAGIRETTDRIEVEGVRRAREALESADIVLLVEDLSSSPGEHRDLAAELPPDARHIRVGNKIDLVEKAGRNKTVQCEVKPDVLISAKTGQGIGNLKTRILKELGAADQTQGSFSARQRHIDALKRTGLHLAAGKAHMTESMSGELLAEELRLAQNALGEITGEVLPDDLLGEIFANFCIGK